jgi:hypothetical protein
MKNKIFMAAAFATISLVACEKSSVISDASAIEARRGRGNDGGVEDNIITVPTAVLQSFTKTFGNVAVREWKLRSDGTYRAHFTRNNVAWEATFKADGTLVKSEPA